jgi:hypothetical protein
MTALRFLLLLALPLTGLAVLSPKLAGSAAAICHDDENVILRSAASPAPQIKVDYDYDSAAYRTDVATVGYGYDSHSLPANSATGQAWNHDLRYDYVRGPPHADFAGLVAPGSTMVRMPASVQSVSYGGTRLLYSGTRQQRALGIVDEAAQAAKVRLSDYVDDVVFTTGDAPFFTVINGRRIIALNRATLNKTRAGRLVDAVHELSHARHSAKLGHQNYMRMYTASNANRGRIEILVETRALQTVERYLGGVSGQQRGWTTRYLDYWRQYYNP